MAPGSAPGRSEASASPDARRPWPNRSGPTSAPAASASSSESPSRWRRSFSASAAWRIASSASSVEPSASAQASTSSRERPPARPNARVASPSAGTSTTVRKATTGSSTAPVVPPRSPGASSAAGSVRRRPRPTNWNRSVSHDTLSASPSSQCASQTGSSSGERRRRFASSTGCPSAFSVWTNSFENAGCAASAPRWLMTTSANVVASMRRARPSVARSVSRPTSAPSGATARHSRASTPPSSRTISTVPGPNRAS